jgi:undecaprenyl-diphosphatase
VSVAAAVILGIVQGLTEFLPVSSSAHLILARAFFGWDVPADFGLAFDVALHVGTLAAIVTYFYRELIDMAASLPSMFSANPTPSARLLLRIIVGTIPAIIVGLLFNDVIEERLRTPYVAATMLLLVGVVMFVAERISNRERVEDSVSWTDAILIGCAQACALVPGVSRSGATISLGMLLGFRRDAAARFTFLLAIPATLAAAAKEGLELRHMTLPPSSVQVMAIGVIVSAVVGYLTIKYFLRFLAGHRLDVFVYYRVALAALTFLWL